MDGKLHLDAKHCELELLACSAGFSEFFSFVLFFFSPATYEREFLKEKEAPKRGRPRRLSGGGFKPACTVCERCELSSGAVQCVKVVAVLWTEAVITACDERLSEPIPVT